MQANLNPTLPPEEWSPYLTSLAGKLGQYCYLMGDLTGQILADAAQGDYEQLREYIRQRGVQAYYEKVKWIGTDCSDGDVVAQDGGGIESRIDGRH